MVKHLHENLGVTSESYNEGPDTLHLGVFREYNDFRNELSKVNEERNKLFQNLKGLPLKKIQKIIGESNFSFHDGEIQFIDGDFRFSFDLDSLDDDNKMPGIWYFVEGQGNMYVKPDNEDGFDNSVFSPNELFPGEWSKDNMKKYLEFSKKLSHELENLNLKIGDKSQAKLSKLFGKLFE